MPELDSTAKKDTDTDTDEYFTPYLKYQIAENAKPCKKTQLFAQHILKKSCLFQMHVAFLGKLPRFIQLVKVGRSKPPPALTSGFNRLKPPRSICQKVVNTGQYESEWLIENFKGPF